MDYIELHKKLTEAKEHFQPEPEKTIFSIGGRGYFENPISDVLSFFLDPREVHNFGNLFLASLFRCMDLSESHPCLDLVGPPKREVVTEDKSRIDLLLEGKEWVLVIENKIYHHQSNPFDEYEKYVEKKYNGKNLIYLILSPGGESVSQQWEGLSYEAYVSDIKKNIGTAIVEAPFSKWHVFMRDFLLNLEQYAMRNTMDSKSVEFVESNYNDLYKLVELRKSYSKHIENIGRKQLESLFPKQRFSTAIHSWPHGPAIRFYSKSWVSYSNLVIYLSHEDGGKGFRLNMYAYNIEETEVVATDEALKMDFYEKPETESKSIRRYQSKKGYKSYEELISDFETTARRFNEFNKRRYTN